MHTSIVRHTFLAEIFLLSALSSLSSCSSDEVGRDERIRNAAVESERIVDSLRGLSREEALLYLASESSIEKFGESSDGLGYWFVHVDGGSVVVGDTEEDFLAVGDGTAIVTVPYDPDTGLPGSLLQPVENSNFSLYNDDLIWGTLQNMLSIPTDSEFLYMHGHSPLIGHRWHPQGDSSQSVIVEDAAVFQTYDYVDLEEYVSSETNAHRWESGEIVFITDILRNPIEEPVGMGWVGITSLFVRDVYPGYFSNQPVVYFSSCHQLERTGEASMVRAFIDKGAAAVVGWDGLVTPEAIGNTDSTLMQYLLVEGMTVREAISQPSTDGYGECRFPECLWGGGSLASYPPMADARVAIESESSCPSGDGLYCGDLVLGQDLDTLYRCTNGEYAVDAICSDGCIAAPPGYNDYCSLVGNACPGGNGLYCGDSSLGQDPDVLYLCIDGGYSVDGPCAYGCTVSAPGVNDYCSMPPTGGVLYSHSYATSQVCIEEDAGGNYVWGSQTCSDGSQFTVTNSGPARIGYATGMAVHFDSSQTPPTGSSEDIVYSVPLSQSSSRDLLVRATVLNPSGSNDSIFYLRTNTGGTVMVTIPPGQGFLTIERTLPGVGTASRVELLLGGIERIFGSKSFDIYEIEVSEL